MINWDAIGIYCIRNLEDGKGTVYVGSTYQSFRFRWWTHRSSLRHNHHCNSKLQNAWNKYGEDAFEFDVLEYVNSKDDILEREKFWIDTLRCLVPLYNWGLIPGKEQSGRKRSKETTELVRKKTSGKNHYFYGQTHSAETIEKIRQSTSGEKNHFFGKKHTKESRKKMSDGLRGEKNPRYGIPITQKRKDAISKANAKPYPALKNLETGEIILSGKNLAALCHKRKFSRSSVWKLITGKIGVYIPRKQDGRWVIAE